MRYVTVLFVSEQENPELFRKVLEECNRCVELDRYGDFRYEVSPGGEGIRIFTPERDRAFKRGSFFQKRFQVNYQVLRED